ncbi:ribonuclease J [Candidatus Termititenax persephonae]|uniref:Ribonuclease J n=1 Tax=Candidatus Termititenax persephonae TaxID=2218525 RepID=A0A388THV5_9BACT|nr:ribonuclease J [Candidatus Termititenax persephonae]
MTKTKITFLGGLDRIGKNMFVAESHDSAVIVDCGMAFPDDEMYGVSTVIPSFEYIRKIKPKVKAVFLTHGHEDHIGALGYLYREFNFPLYATSLTLALADSKFSGTQKKNLQTHAAVPAQVYEFGDIKIEPFAVCHSIPESLGLIIETPDARIVHTGDFKLDPKPLDGRLTDLRRLRSLGNVDLLLCDSTNADQEGWTVSENDVAKTFDKLFQKISGRIVIASFSSNILRMQHVLNVAQKYGRRVAILGRSMENNFKIARDSGYITCPENTVAAIEQMHSLPENKVVVLTTGSQGERMSALTQMAGRRYDKMRLKKEDTVIISASPIPGNEKDINETINNLYRIGVRVLYDQVKEIHASGHACAEEIKELIKAVKPRFFAPVHGEYKHLYSNILNGQKVGLRRNNSFLLQNGDQLEIGKNFCKITGHVYAEPVLLDGNYGADPRETVFHERHQLSRGGVALVTCALSKGSLVCEPLITGSGFLYRKEKEQFLPLMQERVGEILREAKGDQRAKEQKLTKELEKFTYEKLRRRTTVFVNIIDL